MKLTAIEVIYRRPNTSKPAPGHKIYPYLLRGMTIDRANHVWAMDISYLPMRRGFVYLAAVVDVGSRRVLAHRVSIGMEAAFCVEALEGALAKHGSPEIFNTDQGASHLHAGTARRENRHQHERQGCLAGQCLRRAAVAQRQIRGGLSARLRQRVRSARLDQPISGFYNERRPQSALDGRTPDEACFGMKETAMAA